MFRHSVGFNTVTGFLFCLALTSAQARAEASISGHVRHAETGEAAPSISVEAYCTGNFGVPYVCASALSGADGSFSIDHLAAGAYRVCAGGTRQAGEPQQGVVGQCFDHLVWRPLEVDPDYTAIVLVDSEQRTGIDFDLTRGGSITGVLHDAYANEPLANAQSVFYIRDASGLHNYYYYMLTTDENGAYRLQGIAPGTYQLEAGIGIGGFADGAQTYPEPLAVAEADSVAGVDFNFHPDMVVRGRIIDAVSGEGIGGVHIGSYVRNDLPPLVQWTDTTSDAAGNYALYFSSVLSSDRFFIASSDAAPHIDQVYPGIPCNNSGCILEQGQEIPYQAGAEVDGFDFELAQGTAITGRVVNRLTGEPMYEATITVFDTQFSPVTRVGVQEDGSYTSSAFAPGTYYVQAEGWNGRSCVFYKDASCPPPSEDPASGNPTPLILELGQIRQNIDFQLLESVIFRDGFDF